MNLLMGRTEVTRGPQVARGRLLNSPDILIQDFLVGV